MAVELLFQEAQTVTLQLHLLSDGKVRRRTNQHALRQWFLTFLTAGIP